MALVFGCVSSTAACSVNMATEAEKFLGPQWKPCAASIPPFGSSIKGQCVRLAAYAKPGSSAINRRPCRLRAIASNSLQSPQEVGAGEGALGSPLQPGKVSRRATLLGFSAAGIAFRSFESPAEARTRGEGRRAALEKYNAFKEAKSAEGEGKATEAASQITEEMTESATPAASSEAQPTVETAVEEGKEGVLEARSVTEGGETSLEEKLPEVPEVSGPAEVAAEPVAAKAAVPEVAEVVDEAPTAVAGAPELSPSELQEAVVESVEESVAAPVTEVPEVAVGGVAEEATQGEGDFFGNFLKAVEAAAAM